MTTTHATCTHDATPAARARCRKDAREVRALRLLAEDQLIAAFDAKGEYNDWLSYAARHFASMEYTSQVTRHDLARGVLDYFDSPRAYNRTTNPYEIVSITLHSAS